MKPHIFYKNGWWRVTPVPHHRTLPVGKRVEMMHCWNKAHDFVSKKNTYAHYAHAPH